MEQTTQVQKTALQRLPVIIKSLSKIEEKASGFDAEAASTGALMMDILSGKVKQSPDNDMVTLSKTQQRAQAKATAIRAKGVEQAAELKQLGTELAAEIAKLVAAYESDDETPATESTLTEEEQAAAAAEALEGLDEDEVDPDDLAGI